METPDQVGGEEDTLERFCGLCALRAKLDAALVRAGVTRITLVANYDRTRFGNAVVERVKAHLALDGDRGVVAGDGNSRDDALAAALEHAGVTL